MIEGRLEANTRLVSEELSYHLNVSKPPIRGALVHLERDGLVTSKPRGGCFVSEMKLKDIEEIYFIRAALNRIAIKVIVETEYELDFISNLKEILQKMEKYVQENNIKGYFCENVKLYNFLVE
ncbi:MAG: GntR family transcriptional regulator [Candidatus Hodarchaeota archaeon]